MKNKLEINSKTVKKYYHSKIACCKEKEILTLLCGKLTAPQPVCFDENCIEMSVIDGITLSQAIDCDYDVFKIFEKLSDWILQFNQICKNIVLDDINLKNFIWNEQDRQIYGIDFECWHYGDSIQNFAAIVAVIKTARFENVNLQNKLYSHITDYISHISGTDCDYLQESIHRETEKINLRRKAMPLIRKSDCVIIAGGKSSRMGYPKGLLNLDGHSFTDHIIYNTAVFDTQYISANSHIYSDFDCETIPDIHKDIGPLGAFHAAMSHCKSEYVFFIPCDMPFITDQTIFKLYSSISEEYDAAVFTADDRIFPTVAVYRKTAADNILKQIETGNYRLMNLLENLKTLYVDAPYPQQFTNINTPEDYKNI